MPEINTDESHLLDRRDFLKKTGIATGAAAALYIAPQFASVGPRPAYAAGTKSDPRRCVVIMDEVVAYERKSHDAEAAMKVAAAKDGPLGPGVKEFRELIR